MRCSRNALPQLDRLFLTEGGMETVMIFQKSVELASFAAIDLMRRPDGPAIITDYFEPFIETAKSAGTGLILDTPTWRASPDWVGPIGFTDLEALADANRRGVELVAEVCAANATPETPMLASACIGPRGDGYDPGGVMSPDEAEAYHSWQMAIFSEGSADFVSALTMNNINEAIGVTRAARNYRLPVAISFTVETDGSLPTGDTLEQAICEVDEATDGYPAYFMINCAHPTHFSETLETAGDWIGRIQGIRANASKRSHAELDCACELDDGDPPELGRQLAELRLRFPRLTVLGGCCGTDHRHIAEIAKAAREIPHAV